jgi:hypothetical protein
MKKNKFFKSIYILSLLSLLLYIKNKIDIRKSKKEFPNLGKFCYIQGARVHYLEDGKGDETIVFLHDDGGDIYDIYLSSIWQNLKSKYKLVAIDRPGFGYSKKLEWKDYGYKNQTQIIKETLEYLNIEKYNLVCMGNACGIGYLITIVNDKNIKQAVFIDDKFNLEKNITDKLLNLPYIGKFLAWTIIPIILKGNLKLSYSISDELIDKHKFLDNQPDKIITNSKNKYSYKVKEIKNEFENNSVKIKTPIKIVKFDNNSIFQELNLSEYFYNYEYIKIKSLSSLDILNTNEILELF